MTFGEAHELMDLLLDKADQPYFTTEEKDKFLNLAYFDWFDRALDRYDTDPEIAKCLGKLVATLGGRMEFGSRIVMHTSRNGAQSVPFRTPSGPTELADHGVPINHPRSISRYPFARLLHLQVKYVDPNDSSITSDWKEAHLTKSNEHGLSYSDTNSDPFNKADDKNIKCYMEGSHLHVFPTRLDNGLELSGWRDHGTTGFSIAGRWRARCITYPMASNVAAGDSDITASLVSSTDASTWGTRDIQMGSYTYFQQTSSAGNLQYNNNPVGAENWGWPMHICNEIVQNAVRLMTVNIESDNYQNQFIETQQSKSI